MATCAMVLNNTSWQLSNAPCPLSQLNPASVEQVENASPLPAGDKTKPMPVSPG